MSASANTPDAKEVKAGKKPRGSSKQGNHRQPTDGAPDQPEQGVNKKKDRGHQVTWRAKIGKDLKKCFKRDSQAKDTPDRSKTREEREERDSYRMPTTGTSVKPGQGRTKGAQEEQSAPQTGNPPPAGPAQHPRIRTIPTERKPHKKTQEVKPPGTSLNSVEPRCRQQVPGQPPMEMA